MFFSENLFEQTPEDPACYSCGGIGKSITPKMRHRRNSQGVVAVFDKPSVEADSRGRLGTNTGFVLRGIFGRRPMSVLYASACHGASCKKRVQYCAPFLKSRLKKWDAKVIYVFGPEALEGVLQGVWDDIGVYSRWVGEWVPLHSMNAWVIPMYPIKEYFDKRTGNAAFVLSKQWIHSTETDPYELKPKIFPIYDSREIINEIRRYSASQDIVVFDYETTSLKPEGPGQKILCVGMADSKRTIAFPFTSDVREEFRAFLKSPAKKVAANMKFEDRWSKSILKTRVRNWYFDTMLKAHLINGSRGYSGLKFQAFVKYGIPDYSKEVDPYMEADPKTGLNRLESFPIHKLLEYCGMDAWAELHLAGRSI